MGFRKQDVGFREQDEGFRKQSCEGCDEGHAWVLDWAALAPEHLGAADGGYPADREELGLRQ